MVEPLAGLGVVEIAGSVAGGYAAKLLADQGADVVLVAASPADLVPEPDARLYLDAAKQPLRTVPYAELEALVLEADVVIESSAPDPLQPRAGLGGVDHSRLVSVRISPFGSAGPYRGWRSTDCTDYAISGHLALTGDPDREPLQGPAHQPAYAAGLHAAIAALAALEARRVTGRGQVVEVTHFEAMVALHQFTLLRYTHNGNVLRRMGNRYAGPGTPIGLYRCADGSVSLTVPRDDQLERLLAAAGLTHLLHHPGIGSTYDLMHHPTLLDEHLRPWLAEQPEAEVVELLQAMRVPAAPVHGMGALLADPHLAARDAWVGARDDPSVLVPRSPLRIAPLPTGDVPASAPGTDRPGDSTRSFGGPDGPLTGLRVLDLTRVWAGPLAARILADLGADVIMIEAPWARGPATIDRSSVEATHYYPDDDPGDRHWNRIGFVNKYALNKRSVALDLSAPEGRATFERLVGWADVVIENYSPRVMPQLGFDEGRLAELNPSLTYVTMPGYGRTGPAADWLAYGPMIDSHAGLSVLQGYPGEEARKGGVAWPDPVAGLHAAFGTLAALSARRRNPEGRGYVVEVAQLEATVALVGHAVAAFQRSGEEPRPAGNRHPCYAPQGVYRAAGEDRWLALAVTDEVAWAALVDLAGLEPGWKAWDLARRRDRHDDIDAALTRWATGRDPARAAARLQAAGVAAAPVADAADVMADSHLRTRNFFVAVDHPEAGTHPWPRFAAHLSDTPATYRRAAPCLGEHNEEVLRGIAGLDADAYVRLVAQRVVTDRPPG